MSAKPRKIIQLLDHQHNSLRNLIEAERVPDGQFIRRWPWWCQLVDTFNEMNECAFAPEEVHHYVMTLRKRPLGRTPRWEALGDGCASMPGATYSKLSEEDQTMLVKVYTALAERLGAGSDSILVDSKHRKELSKMFASAAGHGINDRSLIAAVIDLRKDARLPKLGLATRTKKRGFNDYDKAAGM